MCELFEFSELKNANKNKYFAHIGGENKTAELLYEHMELTLKYYYEYDNKKDIKSKVVRLLEECGFENREIKQGYEFFLNAIYLHDIGKINPDFQAVKMQNKYFRKSLNTNTEHSIYSAYIYINEALKRYPDIRGRSAFILMAFAYVISCHHGSLDNPSKFEEKLISSKIFIENFYNSDGIIEEFLDSNRFIGFSENRVKKYIKEQIPIFILVRLLFACITSCDFSATGEYKSGNHYETSIIADPEKFSDGFYKSSIYQKIVDHKYVDFNNIRDINDLRCKIFYEAQNNLLDNIDSDVFYLEAPTGSGKTICSINLALKLLEEHKSLNNIFYIFPFNTLVEQTADVFASFFADNEAVVVNSITPMDGIKADSNEELNYEELLLNRMNNNYPLTITTHVNFFNILFGTSREQSFPIIKLCNSVVVIDEIQSYKNEIWPEIINFINTYARMLNIKIIIMSATLPRIDEVFNYKGEFCSLLTDSSEYFGNKLFKNRVTLSDELLKYKDISFDVLLEKVITYKDKKVLVEFITKQNARAFFEFVQTSGNGEFSNIYELSGDDCALTRKKVIAMTRSNVPMLLIATQVIEAGIDIDMDVGFKEISLPDSEEQFLGRINRSCLKVGAIAYFFNKTEPGKVYKRDVRVNFSINNSNIWSCLKNKDFSSIYNLVLQSLKGSRNLLNNDNINIYLTMCREMKFKDINKHMQLIKPSYQIFLPYKYDQGDRNYDGYQIWEDYRNLINSDTTYAEKKFRLSQLRSFMLPFIFNVEASEGLNSLGYCFGGIYYIEDGEDYINEGKFDRSTFIKNKRGLFI